MIFAFRYENKAFDFDDERMGLGEARWVKQMTGLTGSDFFAAARKLDPDAVVAILVLAMRRAGLHDAQMDDIYSDDDNGYFKLIESLDVRESPKKAPAKKAVSKE